jgi:hypothetical protein
VLRRRRLAQAGSRQAAVGMLAGAGGSARTSKGLLLQPLRAAGGRALRLGRGAAPAGPGPPPAALRLVARVVAGRRGRAAALPGRHHGAVPLHGPARAGRGAVRAAGGRLLAVQCTVRSVPRAARAVGRPRRQRGCMQQRSGGACPHLSMAAWMVAAEALCCSAAQAAAAAVGGCATSAGGSAGRRRGGSGSESMRRAL